MTVSLKHAFTSNVADSGDTTLVQPSNWNAEHVLTQATGRLLGRTTAGAGATEEISAGTGLTLSSGSLSVTPSTYVLVAGDTMTGKLTTLASASGGAGFNLPHGAAPSAPSNGDVWTTTGGLYARVNGSTQGPYSTTVGTVTSVGGTGTVNGITLSGTVTSSGNLTLGGTLSNVSLTSQVTGTLPIANGGTGATTAPSALTSLNGYTTTATAGGTTTLTNASSYLQFFTGSSNQTVTLPVVTTLALGWQYRILNNSTGTLTVNSSGGNLVASVPAGIGVTVTVILATGTTAASWDYNFNDFNTLLGTGANVLSSAVIGQQTMWVPASAMTIRSTSGATIGSLETTTNRVMLATLNFDTTAQEFVQFAVQMPKSWNAGTIIAQFLWSHPATTTNFGVVWQIQGVAIGDAGATDTAFGTAVLVTDTGGTTNALYISPETSAVTISNTPAAEKWVVFQVARVPANAGDTLAVDARLHGVKIKYTTNAATDD